MLQGFPFFRFILFIALSFPGMVNAVSLDSTTLNAWEQYVNTVTKQAEKRSIPGQAFLWIDEDPARSAKVRAGEIVVSAVGAESPQRVPSGLIHHWIGAVFVPHVTLPEVLEVVRDYGRYRNVYRPVVADSKLLSSTDAKERFSLVLMYKSLFLRTAFDTDYESCYVQLDERRGYGLSRSTRIQEIEGGGAPPRRMLQEGEGNGIIWRLFTVMRYLERDGGVYLELEAVGLSRDIPPSLQWLAEPIVRRVARGSLSTSLRQTENAVRTRTKAGEREGWSIGQSAVTANRPRNRGPS
jgi:hypothetical protein